jgi:hypothetical protein
VAGRTAAGQWWVSTSTGSGFVTNRWGTGWNEGARWRNILVGDFNGDGKAEVAGRTASGEWWVSLSSGSAFGARSRWARLFGAFVDDRNGTFV